MASRKKYRGGGDASRGGRGRGRGRGGGGGGGGGRGRGGGYLSQNNDFSENRLHHGFSLADEAKNTERHHSDYRPSPLRHSKVSFVAAGHLETSDLFKPLNADGIIRPQTEQTQESTDSTEEDEEDDDPITEEEPSDSPLEASTGVLPQDVNMENLDLNSPEPPAFVPSTAGNPKPKPNPKPNPKKQVPVQAFVVDVVGDPSLKPKGRMPVKAARSPSPGSASSSDSEVIVFIPRLMRPKPPASRADSPVEPRATSRIPSPRQSAPSPVPAETVEETPKATTPTITINDPAPASATATGRAPKDTPVLRATQGYKRRRRRRRKRAGSDDDAAAEDYIENIVATMRAEAIEEAAAAASKAGESPVVAADVDIDIEDYTEKIAAASSKTNHRALGGEDDWSSTNSDEAAEDSDAINAYKAELWEEHELADFDDISTSSEGPKGLVHTLLGKRSRPSGVQYLVQWKGCGTDNATWVLAEALDSSADAKIKSYEAMLLTRAADVPDSSDDNENGNTEEEEEEEEDDDDDEEDVDEDLKLARLIQRQEAMGITDSDLELNIKLDGLLDAASSSRVRGSKKGRKTFLPEIAPNAATGHFPSASRFADEYDGFDTMDWERPSLARSKKGKKGKGKGRAVVPDLSDEELQENLRSSWMKDREKKKARNIERAALRGEGLLGGGGGGGGGGGKRDLQIKYRQGITMEELQMEIKEFLMGNHQSLALPPMDKSARVGVHGFASAFGLKSKSVGKEGKTRFTTLIKTAHTRFADESAVRSAMSNRHFLNRPHPHGPRNGKSGKGGVVHHREGDIVGASAPEIGVENRGRRMLEKMGYVTGMALGLEGRDGIVKPVEAVVKISKAGLG